MCLAQRTNNPYIPKPRGVFIHEVTNKDYKISWISLATRWSSYTQEINNRWEKKSKIEGSRVALQTLGQGLNSSPFFNSRRTLFSSPKRKMASSLSSFLYSSLKQEKRTTLFFPFDSNWTKLKPFSNLPFFTQSWRSLFLFLLSNFASKKTNFY